MRVRARALNARPRDGGSPERVVGRGEMRLDLYFRSSLHAGGEAGAQARQVPSAQGWAHSGCSDNGRDPALSCGMLPDLGPVLSPCPASVSPRTSARGVLITQLHPARTGGKGHLDKHRSSSFDPWRRRQAESLVLCC